MTSATIEKILGQGSHFEDRFIKDPKRLKEIVDELKTGGRKIVLTQGVYDLVHEGHALYLEAARGYGDVLIVGVDSDELTRQRKGPNRPIVPQKERLRMLVQLRHVDIVTLREAEHGMRFLIELICPDVLVTSSSTKDFTPEMVGSYKSFCEKIVTLPPQATVSSTARIRNLTIEGAGKLAERLHQEMPKLVEEVLERIKRE